MNQTATAYIRLMRLDKRVGVYLLLWPCIWSIMLGYHQTGDWVAAIQTIFIFTVGAFVMRSAGCVINDIWDRNIDAQVERTKNRPLVTGEIRVPQAKLLFLGLLMLGGAILFSLNPETILLGFAFTLPVIIYPLMKRILPVPQLFLGLTFNAGALMGYTAMTATLDPAAWWLYAACVFWTLGYDTIYAYQDVKDDLKLGIKSAAVFFGKYGKFFIGMCYGLMVVCLFILGMISHAHIGYYVALASIATHLSWQVVSIHLEDTLLARKIFVGNVPFGYIVLAGILLM